MKLLMISGDRSILQGKKGAFWYTLEEFHKHWERIDIICPRVRTEDRGQGTGERLAISGQWSAPFPNVFLHPSPHGLWYQPWWIRRKGKELIAEHHHDVVTVHEYLPYYNGIGAWLLYRATRIPYAIEIHHIDTLATNFLDWDWWLGLPITKFFLRFDSRFAAAIRCVNTNTAAVLRSWKVRAPIHVVSSMYLDHEKLQPDPSIVKEYDVVCCARLAVQKGIDRTIEAVALLPGVTLQIIGDGVERRRLERLVERLHIRDRVHFTGWLSGNDAVYRALQSVRVCVMASVNEGGPRLALEAMALGLPLMTTRVGLMPIVIEDGVNGLFTTGTPEDLAEKIRRLLGNDSDRMRIGKEATKIREKFERKRLIAQYAQFLQSLSSAYSPL